jgi:hypothetical protein
VCFLFLCVGAAVAPAPTLAQQFPYVFLEDEAEPGREYSLYYQLAPTRDWARRSEARIAFDVRGQDDLRYVSFSRGRAALVDVSAGKPEELAVASAFQPKGAVSAAIQRRSNRALVIADGAVLLRVDLPAPPGGKVGAGSPGEAIRCREGLLQPVAPIYFMDDFTRGAEQMAQWNIVSGVWENTEVKAPGADPLHSANPFSLRCTAPDGGLATAGHWFWDTYRAQTSVKPFAAQAIGLCAYIQDQDDYLLFRWRAGDEQAPRARQLMLVRSGRERALAEAPGGFAEGRWYRLGLECGDGTVICSIDREPVLQVDTDALGQGGIGLWARGDAVSFDDVQVAGLDLQPQQPRITEAFLQDDVMKAQGLYSVEGAWHIPGDGTSWHRGVFFGDLSVRLPAELARAGPLTLAIRAAQPDATESYRIVLGPHSKQLEAKVLRAGITEATGEAQLGADAQVEVAWRDGRLSVLIDDAEVVSLPEPDAPPARRLGILDPESAPALLRRLEVDADNWLDYTFADAPTDWYATKGNWHVTTRWPCEPSWTFFGGVHFENPVAWTKRTYSGDIIFEARTNIQMDLRNSPGYSDPSDANLALCGDGANLDSGYAFIYAGWGNTKSAILRKGQVVAQNTKAVFVEPTSSNAAFHRHWFRLRAEKLGGLIRFLADDKLICEYTDPAPLPGGRAGLWSAGNGLMVARAQLWYESEETAPVPRLPAAPPPREAPERGDVPAIVQNFERDIGEWHTLPELTTVGLSLDDTTASKGKRSLRITNLRPGGPMGAYALAEGFRASRWPRLQFDYRIPPGIKVDVYLHIGGVWHAVRLTGRTPETGTVKLLGDFPDVQADGTWQHAEFDLLPALQRIYPQRQVFPVDYLAFASPDERYLRCGLGGNPMGAAYWIDEFQLTP